MAEAAWRPNGGILDDGVHRRYCENDCWSGMLLHLNGRVTKDCMLKMMDQIDQVAQVYHQFTAVGSKHESRSVVGFYSLRVDLLLSRPESSDYPRGHLQP